MTKKVSRKRQIVCTPSLTETLKIVCTPSLTETLNSLEAGDYVHCGHQWSYGTIREMASKLAISIKTKRSDKGITVFRVHEVPEHP